MSVPSDFEAVKSTNQAFYDAFSNRDIKSMNLLWWQGATSLCVHPGGAILTGWEAIGASWSSIFENTDSFEIEIEVLKLEIDRAVAYVVVRARSIAVEPR